jgi:hypothetical protein
MYRIEISPGEETAFRSIEELAVAIRRGVVTPRARVYHNASGKWLPIQFHPHYKVALSMDLSQAALVAGPPVKPLSSLTLQQPEDPEPIPVPTPSMMTSRPEPPVERPSGKRRGRVEKPAKDKRPRRRGKSSRELRIALVGALLIGGAQWVLSAPLFSRSDTPAVIRAQGRLVTAPIEAMRAVGAANTAAMFPAGGTPNTSSSPESAMPSGELPPVDSLSEVLQPLAPVESAVAAEPEPAPVSLPTASEIAVPAVSGADSLASRMADSSNKKAIKSIMRAVSGSAAAENKKRSTR